MLQKLNSAAKLIQRTTSEAPQRRYVLHRTRRTQEDDQLLREGCGWSCAPGRQDRIDPARIGCWIRTLPQPRMIAMEATIFTGWIYDHLLPHAEKVKVAHPLMLRAIAAAKKKNDKIDAVKIADCLRCDFLPGVPHGLDGDPGPAPDAALSEPAGQADGADEEPCLRPAAGDRGQLQQAAAAQGRLLRRTDVDQRRGEREHTAAAEAEPGMICRSQKLDYALVSSLERDPLLKERLRRLRTVPGVGPITALTWALEIGDVTRFHFDQAGHQLLRPVRR